MSAASLLLLVRSTADLPRACADLSRFLALGRPHDAVARETLLGLWVDRRWVEHLPSELRWREPDGSGGTARIRETVGVDGVWMLCWLDVPEGSRPLSQRAAVAALAAAFGPVDTDPAPAFFPVFGFDAPARDATWEHRLGTEHAGLVQAPIVQDPISGRLQAPIADPVPGIGTARAHPDRGADPLGRSRCAARARHRLGRRA